VCISFTKFKVSSYLPIFDGFLMVVEGIEPSATNFLKGEII